MNLYSYAVGEPVGLIDPSGEGAKVNSFLANPTSEVPYDKAARNSERNLHAIASAANSRDANLVMLHGDSQGLYVNMEFANPLTSTPVSRQLMAAPGFDRNQPTILTACNAANTQTPGNLAIETGTTVFAGTGFVAHQGFSDGTLKLSVNIERGSGKGDGVFREFSSTGQATGREFSQIVINSDGSITKVGTESRTGTRLTAPVKVKCDSKGTCN